VPGRNLVWIHRVAIEVRLAVGADNLRYLETGWATESTGSRTEQLAFKKRRKI
jgi:hypothetical protein